MNGGEYKATKSSLSRTSATLLGLISCFHFILFFYAQIIITVLRISIAVIPIFLKRKIHSWTTFKIYFKLYLSSNLFSNFCPMIEHSFNVTLEPYSVFSNILFWKNFPVLKKTLLINFISNSWFSKSPPKKGVQIFLIKEGLLK